MTKRPYIALTQMMPYEGETAEEGATVMLDAALARHYDEHGLLGVYIPDDDEMLPNPTKATTAIPASKA